MRLPRRARAAVLALLLAPAAVGAPLPESLILEYDLTRNGLGVGEVHRHLQRRADNTYVHTMRTRSTGMARLLTQTEWREEGEFTVHDRIVRPRRYSEIRTGDKRAYEHRMTVDPQKSQIVLGDAAPRPLPPGLQDHGSVLYMLMLDPLTSAGERVLPLTDGKDIEVYRFSYHGTETVHTVFGEHDAIRIRRVSQKQFDRERQCRAPARTDADCGLLDDFIYWLLPAKQYLPVKLERRRKHETTTLTLRAAQ